jgi:threonylcarbamoyladenosine tRNA methylthiotransferase MtaB
MKRRHSRADALRFCDRVRRLRPDVVFGADLIAGFPTETEEMFEGTLSIVGECGLTFLHVFPYSPRPGTPAARMPQLSPLLVQQRAQTVRQQGQDAFSAWMASEVGKTRKILLEGRGLGHTEHYAPVEVAGSGRRGEIVSARIVAAGDKRLSALAFQEAA